MNLEPCQLFNAYLWKRFEKILFEVTMSISNELSILEMCLLSHMDQMNFGLFLCQNLRGRYAEIKVSFG